MDAGNWSLGRVASVQLLRDVITYNAAVSACGNSEQWQQISGLLAETRNMNLLPSVIIHNVAISAGKKSVQGQRALGLLAELRSGFLLPDVITYSAASVHVVSRSWDSL